jgi:hypothetical protein
MNQLHDQRLRRWLRTDRLNTRHNLDTHEVMFVVPHISSQLQDNQVQCRLRVVRFQWRQVDLWLLRHTATRVVEHHKLFTTAQVCPTTHGQPMLNTRTRLL